MDREYRLQWCTTCTKRKFSPQKGLVCSITNEHADFVGSCPDYVRDEEEIAKLEQKRIAEDEAALESETFGLSAIGIRNPIIVGWGVIILALVWLIGGMAALERIFYYPFILIIFGVGAIYFGYERKFKEKNR